MKLLGKTKSSNIYTVMTIKVSEILSHNKFIKPYKCFTFQQLLTKIFGLDTKDRLKVSSGNYI